MWLGEGIDILCEGPEKLLVLVQNMCMSYTVGPGVSKLY